MPLARPPAHLTADAADRTAFGIGWDHARHGLVPPAEHLHAGHPVRQGWQAARAVFAGRPLRAAPAVPRWLALRLHAWHRGIGFDDETVTPALLRRIAAARCPVGLGPLGGLGGHSDGGDDQAVIERIDLAAGFAAGNLVTLSRRAQCARGTRGWRDALQIAHRLETGHGATVDGLGAAEWQRLAVLLSFGTPLVHAEAAALPLTLLPPPRIALRNPVQALQTALTLRLAEPGPLRLAELARLFPDAVRGDLHAFMTTLLARRLATTAAGDGAVPRAALIVAWQHPLVQRRWQRLALALTAAQCERIAENAVARGLAGRRLRCVDSAATSTASLAGSAAGSPVRAAEGCSSRDVRARGVPPHRSASATTQATLAW